MQEALLVRIRATSPWRLGPGDGRPGATAELYHSDALYSAVTGAMEKLGELAAWLEATAGAENPAVRFSSGFPWKGPDLFVLPPVTVWPPDSFAMLHLRGARYLPLHAVKTLLAGGELREEDWIVEPSSRCLLRRTSAPVTPVFRVTARVRLPVDRLHSRGGKPNRIACVEFGPGAGVWFVVLFSGDEARSRWEEPVRAAFRLLADSGFGGGRSIGWGRGDAPLFEAIPWPGHFLPEPLDAVPAEGIPAGEADTAVPVLAETTGYWLLSLYRPGPKDDIAWDQGRYSVAVRGGRVESPAGWGRKKKAVRVVQEGSVLVGGNAPLGSAPDIAPDGFPHPVYRYGFAVSVPIRLRAT